MDDQINNQELPQLTPEQLENLQKAAANIGEAMHTVVDNFAKAM